MKDSMHSGNNNIIEPRSIRLEASTVCQLKCPSCPNASGDIARNLGSGFLRFEDFKDIIDRNPRVSHIELSNWGEIFLNRDLVPMMRYAHRNNVTLSASNGANLNNVTEEVLEALVKYRFTSITCSIDGASAKTYSVYRVSGDFARVLNNIRTINRYKLLYKSPYPALKWLYVAFGHNEHEISSARRMAVDLNMEFTLKLSWEDLYGHPFSPIKDAELIRREAAVGAANRQEYRKKYDKEYALRACCSYMWKMPQINYDGRVLGCPVNYWGDYGNAFQEGLMEALNSERIQYVRDMLMGKEEMEKGTPCATCASYKRMKENRSWLTPDEVKEEYVLGRDFVRSDDRGNISKPVNRLSQFLGTVKRRLSSQSLSGAGSRLLSRIDRVSLPLQPDEEKGWRPYPIFRGATKGLSELSCHVSVLNRDRCPHLPHAHKEEELLLLLSGQVDLIFPNDQTPYGNRRQPLKAGQFVYYPSGFSHTLQTVSESPSTYLMLKWHAPEIERENRLEYGLFNMHEHMKGSDVKEGFHLRVVFDGPTAFLGRLHCHTSTLTSGAGYDPHSDPYDVAIIVLEGEVETLGKRVGPHGVIFYAAGEPHGMRNPGTAVARYIVFEFHKQESSFYKGLRRTVR
jgi:MoaA/NifB/PqqE/SkfB family radical SAM enzyme/quercetin dioxygenase-like cupin family protein